MVRLPAPVRPFFRELKYLYTFGTRAIAPASIALSRARGGWLPTGSVETLEDAAREGGGRVLPARPQEVLSVPAAEGLPADHADFRAEPSKIVPRAAVAELPGGRVLGPKSAVIDRPGHIVQEVSEYFGTTRPREHPLFLHPFPGPPLEVSGRLGVLAIRGDVNYYHFLVDALPRLEIAAQCDGLEVPSRWYVPASGAWQRELLDLLGVGADQRVDRDAHPHVRAETLVVPSLAQKDVQNPPWVTAWLRERLLDGALAATADDPATPERIYVTRGGGANNRRVIGEDQVVARLERRGFVAVEPAAFTVSQQIRLFAGAKQIVGGHGAALTNVIFASPATRVIELLPGASVLPNCYWTLSHTVPGVSYRYLIGAPSRVGRRAHLAATLVSDIDIDIDQLERLLDDAD